ncbi:MAG: hypothetical protein RL095_3201 [Verrucomicrobiota bacterium]
MKRLVVGVDMNQDLEQILSVSLKAADCLGAELLPLHACSHPQLHQIAYEEQTRERIERHLRHLPAYGRCLKPHLQIGAPHTVLLAAAAVLPDSVIVIGSGRDEHHTLGVMARRISRACSQPLWVIEAETKEIRRILCPIDFSPHSTATLKAALKLAAAFKAELRILHVMKEGEESIADFDTFLHDFSFDLLEVRHSRNVRHGVVHQEIVSEANSWSADLVVIGTKGHSALLANWFGGTIERVIERIRCSVFAVP